MKVLVIGGTHFVGRHAVEVLLEHGHQVTVLNRGVSQDLLPKDVQRLRADRTQPEQVEAALRGHSFDAVIDCIGFRPEEMEQSVQLFRDRIGRYVLISSVSVYQPSSRFPIDESFPVQVTSRWAYAQLKVECEQALQRAQREHGFPFVIIRPAYIYGRYNSNPEWEMKMFARIEQGRPVLIPGDGSFIFHHGTARDLAHASLAALTRREAVGNIYNVTGPHAVTANEYVRTVGIAMNREVEVIHVPGVTDRRRAEQFFPFQTRPTQIYSIEHARRDLAWEPQHDLLRGHRDAYAWYVETGYAQSHPYDFSREEEVLAALRSGSPLQ